MNIFFSKKTMALFLLSFLISLPVSANELGEVLDKIILSQENAKKGIPSISVSYKVTSTNEGIEVISKLTVFKKNEKVRIEFIKNPEKPHSKDVIVYDGKEFYQVYSGLVKKLEGNKLKDNIAFSNWGEFLKKYALSIEKTDDTSQSNLYLVKSKFRNSPINFYIDAENSKLMRLDLLFQNTDRLSVRFDQFKTIDMLELPTVTTLYKNGRLISKRELESVSIDKEIPDSYFEVNASKVDMKAILSDLFD
jgi:outer membrane lipoprotein-sorting protein